MAQTPKLTLQQAQTQRLAMTPQMQQSIKLLQMNRLDLSEFIAAEVAINPLLQWQQGASPAERSTSITTQTSAPQNTLKPAAHFSGSQGAAQTGAYSSSLAIAGTAPDIEQLGAQQHSLYDHLAEQINLRFRTRISRQIAEELAGSLDQSGYLQADLVQISRQFSVTLTEVETILTQCQDFDPAGVFARTLSECLRLQLKAQDRLQPAIMIVLDHLDLVAKRDFAALKRLSAVDDHELADMLSLIRSLDPKPGLIFDHGVLQPRVADILVSKSKDGQWQINLNPASLPQFLVQDDYYRTLNAQTQDADEKKFLKDCYQKAHWLSRILDQRARTILKVASDILTRQQDFFEQGASGLKPLTMREVAEATGLHMSTISRVSAHKYAQTPRGIYALRYFFNAAISASNGAAPYASEAVRQQISQLIAQESTGTIFSDDALVEQLGMQGINIARRTVAKYRTELGIASSAVRRREWKMRAKLSS